jgi:hypothetical protein
MIVGDITIFPSERQEERKRAKDFPKAKFSFIMAVLLFILPSSALSLADAADSDGASFD